MISPATVVQLTEEQKPLIVILIQSFEIDKKLILHGDPNHLRRNIDRINNALEELGLFYEDPLGQEFQETRTDLEATISGRGTERLKVVEVIKPIIRVGPRARSRVVQKGIVVVEAAAETEEK